MRWIVGDLQSCAVEFERLLRAIDFDPNRDELWCAGDLINRGPDTLATLRLWEATGGRAVLGNHEVYALSVAAGVWPRKRDTLDELFDAPDADKWLDTLRALPVLVHLPSAGDGPDAWLVHGGVSPQWTDLHAVAARLNAPPFNQKRLTLPDVNFATRVRCCTPSGERCRHDGGAWDCPPGHRPWDRLYTGQTLIVHGHWARRGYYRGKRSLGLDSGCVYGRPLTAWCQDEDRIVQVHSSQPPA